MSTSNAEVPGMNSLGMVEVKGLVAAIEAADAMVKTANVEIISKEIIGGGLVTVICRGDVAAVKAAVDAGALAAKRISEVVAVSVIPRPHNDTAQLVSPQLAAQARPELSGGGER